MMFFDPPRGAAVTKPPSRRALQPATRAAWALSLATLFWSGNFIAGRALRHDIEPVTLNLLRWALCMGLLLPFVGIKTWRSRQVVRREWRLLLALGASGIAGFHTLVYVALTRSTAVEALLMLTLAPAAILVGAVLAGTGTSSRRLWAGSAVSLLGAWLLVGGGSAPAGAAGASGVLWMAAAVVLWAVYSLLLQRRPADLPADVTLAATIAAALLLMLPWAMQGAAPLLPAFSPRVVFALAYIVVFASLGGFLLWSYGVATIGPARAGQFVHLMPLFGAALAMLLLGERVTSWQLAGAACVLAGLALAQRRPRRPASTIVAPPPKHRDEDDADAGEGPNDADREHGANGTGNEVTPGDEDRRGGVRGPRRRRGRRLVQPGPADARAAGDAADESRRPVLERGAA